MAAENDVQGSYFQRPIYCRLALGCNNKLVTVYHTYYDFLVRFMALENI